MRVARRSHELVELTTHYSGASLYLGLLLVGSLCALVLPAWALLLPGLPLVLYLLRARVVRERAVVVAGVGAFLESHSALRSRSTYTFLPMERLQDAVIHEVISRCTVMPYLAFLVEQQRLHMVFTQRLPLRDLVEALRAIRPLLTAKQ